MPGNTELKEECYDCHLKIYGIAKKCVDCKETFLVKKEDKTWKKKCYDCWLEPNRKKKSATKK